MSNKHDIQNKLYKHHQIIHQATTAEIAKIMKEQYPALYVGQFVHKNTRGDSMNFVDADYLLRLYKSIDTEPQQVVIKSVQCFPGDTPILTKTGFRYIKDIVIGDYVLTHNGRFRKVNYTFKRKVHESLLQLRSDVGECVRSTKKHPFKVYPYDVNKKYHFSRYSKVFKPENGVWLDNQDINIGDFVLRANYPKAINSLNFVYLSDYIAVFESGSGVVRCKNSQAFQDDRIELTKDIGKLVGYFIAEGWIRKTRISFGFHIDEIEFVDDVKIIFEKILNNKLVKIYANKKDNCIRVKVCCAEWGQFLKKVCGTSANTKQIPEFTFGANEAFLKGVLLGLFNGDGYYSVQTTYTTVSRKLAIQVQILLSMFRISSVIRTDDRVSHKQIVYKVVLNGIDNQKLLCLLGKSVSKHKYTRTVDLGIHRACRVKEHVEVDYKGYVYNLGVDEDESYVASGYVVHNCGLSELYIIQSHIEAGERGLTVMYVLPKYEIRNRFVNNRIYKLHKKVSEYAELVKEAETKVHRTSLMHYGKGTIAYVGSNVEDEFIEIPVDSAYVDELDRCDLSNLLMLPDRYTASPYKYHREISNPTIEGFGIDERYNESSKAVWMLRCPRCNKLFTPDFYKHVVRQISEHKYIARDTDFVMGETMRDAYLIHDCGGVVNRLQDGEWVHAHPRKKWKGYRISKVFSKFTDLGDLIEKHNKALGNDRKIQVFTNSDLGLAFSSEGAKITRNMLNKCRREYAYPLPKSDKMNARFFGVDVGDILHVIIRERIRIGDVWALRLIHALTVPGFSQLAQLLNEWRPKTGVIDSMPEIHKVADLKADFKNVWSSRFQEKLAELTKHKHIRELRMDRTALLDEVKQGLELERILLPMNAEFIDNGSYYDQMMASTRILEANETNPEKSMYKWRHSKPDHYFLAEGYCLQASMMSPNSSIWDFYTQSVETMEGEKEDELVPITGINNKKELTKMMDLTPETFLAGVQRKMNRKTQVRPKVDIEAIQKACENMHKAQGYVDLDLIVSQVGEHEDDVRRVLLQLSFGESKISGQYIK